MGSGIPSFFSAGMDQHRRSAYHWLLDVIQLFWRFCWRWCTYPYHARRRHPYGNGLPARVFCTLSPLETGGYRTGLPAGWRAAEPDSQDGRYQYTDWPAGDYRGKRWTIPLVYAYSALSKVI